MLQGAKVWPGYETADSRYRCNSLVFFTCVFSAVSAASPGPPNARLSQPQYQILWPSISGPMSRHASEWSRQCVKSTSSTSLSSQPFNDRPTHGHRKPSTILGCHRSPAGPIEQFEKTANVLKIPRRALEKCCFLRPAATGTGIIQLSHIAISETNLLYYSENKPCYVIRMALHSLNRPLIDLQSWDLKHSLLDLRSRLSLPASRLLECLSHCAHLSEA